MPSLNKVLHLGNLSCFGFVVLCHRKPLSNSKKVIYLFIFKLVSYELFMYFPPTTAERLADTFITFFFPPAEVSSYPDDNMPIQSRGGYMLDFGNLDDFNPFQGSNNMALSPMRPAVENPPADHSKSENTPPVNIVEEPIKMESALDETLPFSASVENSLADLSADICSTESSVVIVKVPVVEEDNSWPATPDEKRLGVASSSTDQEKSSSSFAEDAPLSAKGSYNFDFDNLDAVNPFQTGGSKIPNSPVLGRKVSNDDALAEESKQSVVEVAQELPVQHEVKHDATVDLISADTAKPPPAESQPADDPVKEGPTKNGPVKLEFNFDDGAEVKRKPPPKKFGKRPTGVRPKEPKQVSDVKPPKEAEVKPEVSYGDADALQPKSSYSFDFEKFDDPNFNPFGTKTAINNSPVCSRKSSPEPVETAVQEQTDVPVTKEAEPPAR